MKHIKSSWGRNKPQFYLEWWASIISYAVTSRMGSQPDRDTKEFSHQRSHFLSADMYIAKSDLKSGQQPSAHPQYSQQRTPDNQPLFPHTARGQRIASHRIASPNNHRDTGTHTYTHAQQQRNESYCFQKCANQKKNSGRVGITTDAKQERTHKTLEPDIANIITAARQLRQRGTPVPEGSEGEYPVSSSS